MKTIKSSSTNLFRPSWPVSRRREQEMDRKKLPLRDERCLWHHYPSSFCLKVCWVTHIQQRQEESVKSSHMFTAVKGLTTVSNIFQKVKKEINLPTNGHKNTTKTEMSVMCSYKMFQWIRFLYFYISRFLLSYIICYTASITLFSLHYVFLTAWNSIIFMN